MLALVKALFETLRDKDVAYCHWKSNASLADALNGEGDLDLLIGRDHQEAFEHILKDFGFKIAVRPSWESQIGIAHYYGLDAPTGRLVHLHVYDSLLTGGSLIKKYHFPLETSLLESSKQSPEGVRIPAPEQELALLLIRKMLEHVYLPEFLLLTREEAGIRHEIRWLLERTSPESAFLAARSWWPYVEQRVLEESLRLLVERGPGMTGWILGHRLRSALRSYEIFPRCQAAVMVWKRFFRRLIQRLPLRRITQSPASGGAIIAVVGPDATGKSTIVAEIQYCLSRAFRTHAVHMGKPPITCLTLPARFVLPMAKRLFPRHRTTEVENAPQETDVAHRPPLLYALRRLMIAYERNRAAKRACHWAAKGFLVVCDRYPSRKEGAMDGPQLKTFPTQPSGIYRQLADWEDSLYRDVPPPDIVLKLSVSVKTALKRNSTRRDKPLEEESYISLRHLQEVAPPTPIRQLCEIETSGALCDTLAAAKEAVWKSL